MNVAIIGAGIGGLAAGSFLARGGHQVSIFEAYAEATPVGAGLLLQPPGQSVLAELGLLDAVKADGLPIAHLQSKTTSGQALLNLSYDTLEGPARNGLGTSRDNLHRALLTSAIDAGADITYSAEVSRLDHQDRGIRLVSGENNFGPFDFIVVSSGSRSDWLNDDAFKRRAVPYSWGCMWATVPLPAPLAPDTLHQRCRGTRKMIGLLPIHNSPKGPRAALYWSVKESNAEDWFASDYQSFLDELHGLWPEAAAAASTVQKDAFTFAKYKDTWTKRPYNSRILLIGDAAHGTSPQLGQGASMALLDAKALSDSLNECGNDLSVAMACYAKKRLKHQRYVRYASRGLTPIYQHDSNYIGIIRDALSGPGSKLPYFRGLAVRTLACEVSNGM